MIATQSPLACTIAWLTVVALLFSGAPARRQATKILETPDSTFTAGKLPSASQAALASELRSLSSQKLGKVWEFIGLLTSARIEVPGFRLFWQLVPDIRVRDLMPQRHWVGILALRI